MRHQRTKEGKTRAKEAEREVQVGGERLMGQKWARMGKKRGRGAEIVSWTKGIEVFEQGKVRG